MNFATSRDSHPMISGLWEAGSIRFHRRWTARSFYIMMGSNGPVCFPLTWELMASVASTVSHQGISIVAPAVGT